MLAAAALGVLLSTAACAGTTPAPAPTAAAPAPTSTAAPSAPGGPAAGPGGPAAGPGGGATTAAGGGPAECRTRDLRVGVDKGPAAGPGLRHDELLVFANESGRTCAVQGFPGVSFVAGDSGTQVGSAFARTSARTHPVDLAPGERAYAPITITQAPNACSPVTARGFRVYPPDETAAVFVAEPQLACTDPGQSVGLVAPVAAAR